MLAKFLLFPYYLALRVRHFLYNKGIWKVEECDVPTICVGNIAAGGTGKTPHTEMILKTLLATDTWKNKNIAVLSRGHKRKSSGFQQVTINGEADFCGDEPLQIKTKFPQATVAVDRSRIEGCKFLRHPELLHRDKRGKKCEHKDLQPADLIILDDAFQYRALKAYFNIVLVDYNRPVNKDCLLPLGRLRDLPYRLNYADIIIVTKCPNYIDEGERTIWINSLGIKDFNSNTCIGINKQGKKVTILFSTINYCPLQPMFEQGDNRYLYSKNLILFSGIAKDTPLKSYLSGTYKIVKHFKFNDHHKYKIWDIKRIMAATKAHPTAIVATTEKDCQRLKDYKKVPEALKTKLFQVPIEVVFLTDNEQIVFEHTLFNALKEFHPAQQQMPRE